MKGFNKVFLLPGEVKMVTIPIQKELFSHYDEEQERWMEGKGKFKIMIGSSSKDIELEGVVTI